MYMTDSEFIAKYPEQKPVCFNYMTARTDILALREENLRLRKRLAAFDEGLNPDTAKKFSAVADSLLEKLDALIGDTLENPGTKNVSVNEISQFLQNAGFEEASKALDCRYSV